MTAGVRRGVLPFLLVSGPLLVEAAGRWIEVGVSLAGIVVAVGVWRRWPLAVLSLAVVGALVPSLVLAPTVANPVRVWPFVACAVFGYLVGRWVQESRAVLATLGAVLLAGLPVSLVADTVVRGGFGVLFGLYDWIVLVLAVLLVVVLPWLGGRYLLLREQLRSNAVQRAATDERTRIAREMHDSLGHELSLIALRAAAFEVSPRLDDPDRERAGEIRAGIAAATERLHTIVGLLGDDDADVEGLVRRATEAGQSIVVDAVPAMPATVARGVHAVVREGLTNAAKHAPGQPVTIQFDESPNATTVTVSNPVGHRERAVGSGSGLAGLRERATVDAGIRDDQFVLTAAVEHEPTRKPAERPRMWRLVRAPLLAAVVVGVLGAVLYAVVGADNRLRFDVYQKLHLGQSQEDVENVLPRFQILGDPDRLLPRRDGDCRNYWADVQTDERLFFRLCFVGGELSTKEVVPRSAVSR